MTEARGAADEAYATESGKSVCKPQCGRVSPFLGVKGVGRLGHETRRLT